MDTRDTTIIGAGPTGLFLGIALARRGHRVTLVERDPGPAADGSWPRRGVMQFHHAHAFRGNVAQLLRAELPDAYDGWLAAGVEPMPVPGMPDLVMGVRSRRETFERPLRELALRQPGLRLLVGHADEVTHEHGRATGVVVDGRTLAADLVIDASGRSGRVSRGVGQRSTYGGSCGIAYVDRQYQLRDPGAPGPLSSPIAWVCMFDGYQVLVFLHERGIFSVLIIRPTVDRSLVGLREDAAFERACAAIPGLDTWTDPDRARPITSVLPGGNLANRYAAQHDGSGRPVLAGLVFAGDSVCTTTPNFGRGITTSLLQASRLLALLDEHGRDLDAAQQAYAAWCDEAMLPWVQDHVWNDECLRRRFLGEDVDLSAPIPSDLLVAAGEVDPVIAEGAAAYGAMMAGPQSLLPLQPRAHAVYSGGWRPPMPDGPDRAELAALACGIPAAARK